MALFPSFRLNCFVLASLILISASSIHSFDCSTPRRKASFASIASIVNLHSRKRSTRYLLSPNLQANVIAPPVSGTTSQLMTGAENKGMEEGRAASSSPFDSALHAIGSSTSALVSLTFFAVMAYRRDALMVAFFLGSICNAVLCKVLKRVLNQDRPEDIDDKITLKPNDKGMPSSHATSLGFICMFTAFELPHTAIPLSFYVFISLFYRIRANLHTKAQIGVGVVLGVFNAIIWRRLMNGTFPLAPKANILEFVSKFMLPPSGILPMEYLVIPAIIGLVVVGSFERRIGGLVRKSTGNAKNKDKIP